MTTGRAPPPLNTGSGLQADRANGDSSDLSLLYQEAVPVGLSTWEWECGDSGMEYALEKDTTCTCIYLSYFHTLVC